MSFLFGGWGLLRVFAAFVAVVVVLSVLRAGFLGS